LLKLPDVICDLKAATFPALTPEVAESCLREYFNNWIMKKYDDCELLANRYFSTLENSGGSDAIFFHSLEILRYTGKISKFAKSDDFKHFSSIMKSVYPGYNFMVNVVGWVTFSYSSSCGVILNHLPPFFFSSFLSRVEVELHHLDSWENNYALSNIAALCDFFNTVASRENTVSFSCKLEYDFSIF